MTNLKILNVRGWKCRIDQKGIQGLDLIELDCDMNGQIKDISFMTNLKKVYKDEIWLNSTLIIILKSKMYLSWLILKKLYADKDCGIDQKGIQGLDLIELYCTINEKIKDVSFMRNLKILYVDNCGIDQQGIRGLDLIELHCRRNEKIKDISFMKNLTSWSTSYSCVY